MSKLIRSVAAFLCLALISGCSLFQGALSMRPEPVLLAPSAQLPAEILKQSITLSSQDHSNTFLSVVRLSPEKTSLVALTLAGQAFLTQSYDGQRWHSENLSGQELPEQEMFSMMQFALWPAAAIEQAYSTSQGWRIEVRNDSRIAYYHGTAYITVSYGTDSTQIVHERGHYTVDIKTFAREPLKP